MKEFILSILVGVLMLVSIAFFSTVTFLMVLDLKERMDKPPTVLVCPKK